MRGTQRRNMARPARGSGHAQDFWRFVHTAPGAPATGDFAAAGMEKLEHKYLPLANEAGMLSWASPQLQGSPAAGFHEFLGLPLASEDLAHCLVHRGFWLVEDVGKVFSLSNLSPQGLTDHLEASRSKLRSHLDAGPGWLCLTRRDPRGRFSVSATLWCPSDVEEKLEFMWIKVTNTSAAKLRLHPFAAIPIYARSADRLRDHRNLTSFLHRHTMHSHGVTVRPCMSFDERGHKVNRTGYTVLAFGPAGAAPRGIWRQQRDFIGEGGNYAAPAAVWQLRDAPPATKKVTEGGEAIGGFRFPTLLLAPGKAAEFLLLAGISDDPRSPARWTRMAKPDAGAFAQKSFRATKQFWQDRLDRISFRTADPVFNNWLTWVNLQPILRRIYGNSYLPDFDYGHGGKGWRDLWQDCLALLLGDPSDVRGMLLHNFGGIRIDGSNATVIGEDGAFIADRNNIPRAWMDHGAWPTLTTLLYIDQTGDLDILLEPREYYHDHLKRRCKEVDPTWDEASGVELLTKSGKIYEGTILEHLLVQTLTAFFNVGEHNYCRLEDADWNDGLDMAPNRGESVAFSAFYAWNLRRLADIVKQLARRGHKSVQIAREMRPLLDGATGVGKVNYRSPAAKRRRLDEYLSAADSISGRKTGVRVDDLVKDLLAKSHDLTQRIRSRQWLTPGRGLGYFNGYYDDHGRRVEGRARGKTQMVLTGQVFTIASGIATDQQVDSVIRAADRLLWAPKHGGLRLNTDFGTVKMDLGRAFGFQYGEKENGGVFCHMAIMYAYALYLRRRADAGRKVWATLYQKAIDQPIARILPGLPEYFNANGRGKYCYLTGSASWLIYLLLTQVFGIRGDLGDLVIDPQLTKDDFYGRSEVTVKTHFAGRPLVVTFKNPQRLSAGEYQVDSVSAANKPLPVAPLPAGGARIPRSAIERLAKRRESLLTVRLIRASRT